MQTTHTQKLTDRQKEIVMMIYDCKKLGTTPTFVEIAKFIGVSSKQTVKDHLDAIAKKGWIRREPNRPRAIILKKAALKIIDNNKEQWMKKQLGLKLVFEENAKIFSFANSTNVTINQGTPYNTQKILLDNSSIIHQSNIIKDYKDTQFVVDKSNIDTLENESYKQFMSSHSPLVVSPFLPNTTTQSGYFYSENKTSLYKIFWSGVNTDHHYFLGKEYNNTSNISILDNSGQMKLFPLSMDAKTINNFINCFSKQVKSWSQYVDFPIYGAALKQNNEIIFWSRQTSSDVNDLRYFILNDVTGFNLMSKDRILLRDVSYNF